MTTTHALQSGDPEILRGDLSDVNNSVSTADNTIIPAVLARAIGTFDQLDLGEVVNPNEDDPSQ